MTTILGYAYRDALRAEAGVAARQACLALLLGQDPEARRWAVAWTTLEEMASADYLREQEAR